MKKREMEQFVREHKLNSYHVVKMGNGEYVILHGENDPLLRVNELQLELDLVKSQFKYAMELAFKRNPDLRERYGHICPNQKESPK